MCHRTSTIFILIKSCSYQAILPNFEHAILNDCHEKGQTFYISYIEIVKSLVTVFFVPFCYVNLLFFLMKRIEIVPCWQAVIFTFLYFYKHKDYILFDLMEQIFLDSW